MYYAGMLGALSLAGYYGLKKTYDTVKAMSFDDLMNLGEKLGAPNRKFLHVIQKIASLGTQTETLPAVHPLADLYNKIGPRTEEALNQLPVVWRERLSNFGGRDHFLAHPKQTIDTLVHEIYDELSAEQKNRVHRSIWELAHRPNEPDYGRVHAKDNTIRLISALQEAGALEKGQGVRFTYLPHFESQSSVFNLGRRELPRGEIGLVNGMGPDLNGAIGGAEYFSSQAFQGHNIHGVHSASDGMHYDLCAAVIGQSGVASHASRLILNKWQEFFKKSESDRYLEVCISRGAVDVYNALKQLPQHQRDRIVVIGVTPAYVIPRDMAHQVYNLVTPSDTVVRIAPNSELVHRKSEEVLIVDQNHGRAPHDAGTPNYLAVLERLGDHYIRHNRLPDHHPHLSGVLLKTGRILQLLDNHSSQQEEINRLIDELHAVWGTDRINFHVWRLADGEKAGDNWGFHNRYRDIERLKNAVKASLTSHLPQEHKS